jgi:hypothetical protein
MPTPKELKIFLHHNDRPLETSVFFVFPTMIIGPARTNIKEIHEELDYSLER